MNSGLFVPRIYERENRCVRALLHVATLNGGNLIIPRLMGVLKASVPLFIDVTGKKLVEETIRTHRGVADAIAARNPTAAHDAMYLHLVYNRNMIAEGAQAKSE